MSNTLSDCGGNALAIAENPEVAAPAGDHDDVRVQIESRLDTLDAEVLTTTSVWPLRRCPA